MIFHHTRLPGVIVVEPERLADERGFFARTWDRDAFAARGMAADLVQCNVSFNQRLGTLRGMHYQAAPYGEVKLVRCTQGAIFDVVVDLRPGSPTFHQWTGMELSAQNRMALYIPQGLAHGFQTLCDECEVFYQMSSLYHPASARGVRYNDPAFGIAWPLPVSVIHPRDAAFPLLAEGDA